MQTNQWQTNTYGPKARKPLVHPVRGTLRRCPRDSPVVNGLVPLGLVYERDHYDGDLGIAYAVVTDRSRRDAF